MHVGVFFQLHSNSNWLPCKIEALTISASINHWSSYFLESSNTLQILSYSWPCSSLRHIMSGQFSSSVCLLFYQF